MKKIITLTLVIILLFQSITVLAAYEECTEFAQVCEYNGNVYSTYYAGSNGGLRYKGNGFIIHSLPYGMMDEGLIYSFCFYNDKIYYMTGENGSDTMYPAKIYSCDLSGANNVLIADNVEAWSKVFIVDNILYYQAYQTYGLDYRIQGRTGGVYKINLEDLSWYKIPNTDEAKLYYCDGDYAYCKKNNNYYAMGCFEFDWVNVPSWADEYDIDRKIRGNVTFAPPEAPDLIFGIERGAYPNYKGNPKMGYIENIQGNNMYLCKIGEYSTYVIVTRVKL